MTKKHFVIMAEAIRHIHDKGRKKMALQLMCEFATMAKAENPRFDYEKFKTACGF